MRDVRTTALHHLACLPTYMERKQESSCGKKHRQMTKQERLEPEERLKPHPLTHAERKGLRCFFSSDHGCTAPMLNTHCCDAKDAVTVQ